MIDDSIGRLTDPNAPIPEQQNCDKYQAQTVMGSARTVEETDPLNVYHQRPKSFISIVHESDMPPDLLSSMDNV